VKGRRRGVVGQRQQQHGESRDNKDKRIDAAGLHKVPQAVVAVGIDERGIR
jgi:hypothetical protein